jgi:hypothetical protein
MIPAFMPPAIALGVIGVASGVICIDAALKADLQLTAATGIIAALSFFLATVLVVV